LSPEVLLKASMIKKHTN